MGKELIGTYRAFFPIQSDINNNYNDNTIGFPKKEKEHGDDLQDGDTPSRVYAQPADGINHLPPIQLNRQINPNSEMGPHLRFQSAGKMGKSSEPMGKQTPASGGAP
ncbi:MAG: hypothetical protein JXA08_04200 [Methanomicrobiaceae archaeon]|nr:hypothetical protein [Methanomicrobiaceae archaeon]